MGIFNKTKKSDNLADDQVAAPISVEEKEKPAVANVAKPKKEKVEGQRLQITGVLLRPIITEKTSGLGALNQYAFAVAASANKIKIAKAVESRYGIKPESINVLNYSGKNVRYGRTRGKTKDWKKAIITLPEGKTIDIYEQVK